MHLNELKALHVSEILQQAEALEIENTGRMRKQELMFAIIKKRAKAGEQVFADGVLEILPDGFGFLRSADYNYLPGPDDIYVSPEMIRQYSLRKPAEPEMYLAFTRFPLDPRRQWTVDLWSPPTEGASVEFLARATLCFRSPGCSVSVALPAYLQPGAPRR